MKVAIGAIATIVISIIFFYSCVYYTADVRGRIAANEQIKSGSNRIAQYDRFFNICASVQALELARDQHRFELAATSNETRREQIRQNINAVNSLRARAITTYNADARKNYTSGQFRDSDLPYEIDLESEYTKCGDF